MNKDEFDLEAITKAARTDVHCVLPGSVLLYLANVIKDKHLQMQKLISLGKAVDANTDTMERALEANETVGAFLLGLIQNEFGEEFLNMFTGGDPEPNSEGSQSIN